MTTYSEKFRSEMVSKMLGPNRVSANALAARVGVGQPTLSRWLREAKMAPVSRGKQKKKKTDTPKRRARQWTAAEKLRVVIEAGTLDEAGVGELLRREGLHAADLQHFREEALAGLEAKATRAGESPEAKRIKCVFRASRSDKTAHGDHAFRVMAIGAKRRLLGALGLRFEGWGFWAPDATRARPRVQPAVASAFVFRRDGPARASLWAPWVTRSQTASATVGSARKSCQRSCFN